MNIVEQLYSVASVSPERTALAEYKKTYSYNDFISDINNTAACLEQNGILFGDRVLLAVPVSYKLYVHFAALLSLGAVIVIIDDWSSAKKINNYLAGTHCKAVIVHPKYYLFSYLIKGLRKIPLKIQAKRRAGAEKPAVLFNAGDNHPALITFTTGSTGKPKAAVRTHKVLNEQFRLLDEVFSFSQNTVLLSNLPIVTLLGFANGGTSVLPAKVNYRSKKGFTKVAKQIQDNRVNCLLGSPAYLLNLAEILPLKSAGQIKKIGIGGAVVSPDQYKILRNAFPTAEINVVYGSTEAEPISTCTTVEKALKKGVPVGKPVKGVQVRIIPMDYGPLNEMPGELPPDQVGEIIVTGPQVVNDYLEEEDIFKYNKIVEGHAIWHRTGDAGFKNENGDLFFSGRCKWLFTVNDELYSPLMYELLFEASPEAIEGTAIATDGRVHVFVVNRSWPDEAGLTRLLADNRLPCDEIRFVKGLPRDKRHHSKTNYELLKTMC
ncbi:MAG TPA: AMP-binding protein [Bacteroidia bacterium]|nr:AMP-binding protein [Bacteroidia bacterium]